MYPVVEVVTPCNSCLQDLAAKEFMDDDGSY